MRTAEQNEVLGTFLTLLEGATGDGGRKRAAGLKPSWKVDRSHLAAAYRHLDPSREPYDEDSGLPKEVHAAWRLLAVAWQRMHDDGKLPEEPPATLTYASTTTLSSKIIAEEQYQARLIEAGDLLPGPRPPAILHPVEPPPSRLPDRWWLKRPDHDAEPVRIPTAQTFAQPSPAGAVDPEVQAAKNWGAPDPGQSADHDAVGFGDWGERGWWGPLDR